MRTNLSSDPVVLDEMGVKLTDMRLARYEKNVISYNFWTFVSF